jgi:two-component system, NtrC family, nitrogen regulation sensor histidine kinase NtrY
MGRLELKLLALLLLLTGLPLGVAFWLSGALFERSLGAGLNPQVGAALQDSVQIYGDYVRAEKARQRSVAEGMAQGRELQRVAVAGPEPLRQYLAKAVARPRVFAVALDVADGPPVEARAPPDVPADWLTRTVTIPLTDLPGYEALHYTFGLERAFLARFESMEAEVIRPFSALAADRDNLADVYAWSFIGYLGAALFVAALVAVLTGRRVTSRLRALRTAMQAVAAGEMDVRLVPGGRDEVAELARGFNEMANRLGAANKRLQYLTQVSAWQDIARRLAHEIKNPLTPILLAVQQVHRSYKGDDARFRRSLDTANEVVEQEVQTLKRLVENFSRFARLPAVSPIREDLAALSRELVAGHPEIAGLEVDAPESPVWGLADRGLLRQALANLLKNAHEGHRGVDGAPRVRLSVVPSEDLVALQVDDNGVGVPEDRRESIFEPYVTHKEDGTGLGLAIVKKIVLEHGGHIHVEASPLGGARFVVTLPACA